MCSALHLCVYGCSLFRLFDPDSSDGRHTQTQAEYIVHCHIGTHLWSSSLTKHVTTPVIYITKALIIYLTNKMIVQSSLS